ncbi:MAG: permease prefix domain 1-containing protein [Acidobacteriota bacterium]|nr:permease prefix domain 1-containing protein [Acidobacteriota bacterium]
MRWWRRKQSERDLERELRSHLELESEEQQEQGLPAAEARYAAQRAFGNITLTKEEVRHVWGWTSLERLGQDLRYGLRTLLKNPGFSSLTVTEIF